MKRSFTRLAAGITLGAALFVPHAMLTVNAQPADINDEAIVPMDESQMSEMRGKFVPAPSSARAVEAVMPTLVTGITIPQVSQNVSFATSASWATPALNGNQITGVDVNMTTAWQHSSQTDIAGVSVSVNAQNQTANVNSWKSTLTPGGTTPTFAAPPTLDKVSPLTSTSGIGQTLQVAGDGNLVRNHIDIGLAPPTTFTPPVVPNGFTSSACSSCVVNTVPGTIGVGIAGSGGGLAGQVLGSGGVLQSAVVNNSYNQVLNTLQLSIHTAPTGGAPIPQLLPILRAANIFH